MLYRHHPSSPQDRLCQRCRNSRCRVKLPAPVGNTHKAFCCRGCFDSFYRAKCVVCERNIGVDPLTGEKRKRLDLRKFCGRKCQAEARRYPHIFAWGLADPVRRTNSSRSADSTGTKIGIAGYRPTAQSLRGWWWGDPGIGDLSLYDADGLTLARIVVEDGRYHLRKPIVTPRQSWVEPDAAKRGAENFALMAMSLEAVLAARIRRDNATPNPMGPSLNRLRPTDIGDAIPSRWVPVGDGADIPQFMQRTPVLRVVPAAAPPVEQHRSHSTTTTTTALVANGPASSSSGEF